jgi:F-type H+-transporting ATPase subunit delta
MVNSGHIPLRYAKALYRFAAQTDVQLKLYNEIRVVLKNIDLYPSFRSTMLNPIFKVNEKKALIMKAFGINISEKLNRFVDLIIENKRESLLPEILIRFVDYYRESNNILSSKLITSVAVDKKTYDRLFAMVERITSAKIEMEVMVDASILGGFILEVDSMRWEASIANELEKIRSKFKVKNKRISL